MIAPRHSTKSPATLSLGDSGTLILVSDDYQTECTLSDAVITTAIGNMPRNVTFPCGHVFVCNEPQKLNLWLAKHQKISLIAKLERSWGLIIIASIFTVIFGYGLIVYGVPAAAKTIAYALPSSIDATVGKHTFESLDDMGFTASALPEKRQQEVQQVFANALDKLKQQDVLFPLPPVLMFREYEYGVNAFALTSGHVILTDDMVKLANNDQLEAVLLHELGHIHHRHLLTQLVQSAMFSIGAAIMVGETSGISDTLVSVTVLGASLHYSRDHEREADEFAAKQLIHWHQSTESLIQLYELLKSEQKIDVPDWASTHPELDERIKSLKQSQ